MEAHSKRAAEIAEEMERTGHDSYRARNIAARTTRGPKRHSPIGELMPRWVGEIGEVGWSVERIAAEVDRAAVERRLRPPELSSYELRAAAEAALDPDGPLAARKVFTKRDVIVAVAPGLYGRDLSQLARVVQRTLADPEAVALLQAAGAHQRAYATATTIAREQAIARCVELQVRRLDAVSTTAAVGLTHGAGDVDGRTVSFPPAAARRRRRRRGRTRCPPPVRTRACCRPAGATCSTGSLAGGIPPPRAR